MPNGELLGKCTDILGGLDWNGVEWSGVGASRIYGARVSARKRRADSQTNRQPTRKADGVCACTHCALLCIEPVGGCERARCGAKQYNGPTDRPTDRPRRRPSPDYMEEKKKGLHLILPPPSDPLDPFCKMTNETVYVCLSLCLSLRACVGVCACVYV